MLHRKDEHSSATENAYSKLPCQSSMGGSIAIKIVPAISVAKVIVVRMREHHNSMMKIIIEEQMHVKN